MGCFLLDSPALHWDIPRCCLFGVQAKYFESVVFRSAKLIMNHQLFSKTTFQPAFQLLGSITYSLIPVCTPPNVHVCVCACVRMYVCVCVCESLYGKHSRWVFIWLVHNGSTNRGEYCTVFIILILLLIIFTIMRQENKSSIKRGTNNESQSRSVVQSVPSSNFRRCNKSAILWHLRGARKLNLSLVCHHTVGGLPNLCSC